MRPDGRAYDQLRVVRFHRGFVPPAEGSVLLEMGHTRVICTASIEEKVPQSLTDTGQGWVTAEYAMLPRCTAQRTPRGTGGRAQEIQRLIGRSLRAVVDLHALGERTVWIDCDVLQADGGTRTASITGAFVALWDAMKYALSAGLIQQMPIRQYVAAVSVGVVEGQPRLDLTYAEDFAAQVDMNVVMTQDGRLVELQGTAEQEPFSQEQLLSLLELARKGIAELITLQRQAIEGSP